MKINIIYIAIYITFASTLATTAYAQTASPQAQTTTTTATPASSSEASPQATTLPTREARPSPRATTRPLSTERAQQIREQVEEKKKELTEKNKETIRDLAKRMISRLDAVNDRQTQITGRLESRIQKLKEQKINTSALERQLNTLNTILTQQEAMIEAIMPTLDETLTSQERDVKAMQESVKKVTDQFRTTHQSIKKLAADIRKLQSSPQPSATFFAPPTAKSTTQGSPASSDTRSTSATPRVSPSPTGGEEQ